MYLEAYCTEDGKIVNKPINGISEDFQAEGWVSYMHYDPRVTDDFFKWVLCDEKGIRCVWEYRKGIDEMPNVTQRSNRFTGNWEKGPDEIAI